MIKIAARMGSISEPLRARTGGNPRGSVSAGTCPKRLPEKPEKGSPDAMIESHEGMLADRKDDPPVFSRVAKQPIPDPKQQSQDPIETVETCTVTSRVSHSHVQPCRALCSHADFPVQGDPGPGLAETQLRPAQGDAHQVRISQDRPEFSDSGERRSEILHLVSSPIRQQSEAGAPENSFDSWSCGQNVKNWNRIGWNAKRRPFQLPWPANPKPRPRVEGDMGSLPNVP